jgi:biopolymer transport protein ExbB
MTRLSSVIVALLLLVPAAGIGQDVREAARKAESERQAAEQRAKAIEQTILGDRGRLVREVDSLEARQKMLEGDIASLERRIGEREKRRQALADEWGRREIDFKEVSGNAIMAARDLQVYLEQSPMTALDPPRLGLIEPILAPGHFPSIDDISTLAGLYLDEMRKTGQVRLVDAAYVGRDGEDRRGKVLMLGRFTALYRGGGETGFLTYAPESKKFFALSERPSRFAQGILNRYFEGKADMVPFDISSGSALRQLTKKQTLMEHLRSGGPIVLPIIALGIAAVFIVIAKIRFLDQVRRKTGKYMTRVNALAAEGKWEDCEAIVKRHKGEHSPVNHVIEAGLTARHEDRETLESVLQESILRELPRLERGLSPLAVFGAVAPLLGLLGTVTGMIETFNVITVYGTGDPKLMSSGISEALVTTEVGLVIAIPIILIHNFLSRRVDAIVGEMEEKAVSLSNIIERERKRNGSPR